jgi:hypothetical protein
MANKKIFAGILVALSLGFITSCASIRTSLPVMSQVNGSSAKTGIATEKVWFGIIGKSVFPTISEAAKNGNITKVATVEYYVKPVILSILMEFSTIVTGE